MLPHRVCPHLCGSPSGYNMMTGTTLWRLGSIGPQLLTRIFPARSSLCRLIAGLQVGKHGQRRQGFHLLWFWRKEPTPQYLQHGRVPGSFQLVTGIRAKVLEVLREKRPHDALAPQFDRHRDGVACGQMSSCRFARQSPKPRVGRTRRRIGAASAGSSAPTPGPEVRPWSAPDAPELRGTALLVPLRQPAIDGSANG